jgi:glycosyltransferase involved in cell wall biosynthesis/ribosomal protein S18 acetylase RimI-like enzyme
VRIAWFTPFSARSAIAEYSDHVGQALAAHADVDLWVADPSEHRSTNLPVVDFQGIPLPVERLAEYDALFYNIGDHLAFHGAIYDASCVFPGIVVLHDRICHNLFFNYWISRGRPDRYVDLMGTYYGSAGRSAAEASFEGRRPPVWSSPDDVVRFPLFEEALVGARGVVVHSESQAETVRERWLGPVASLFLPAYAPTGNADRVRSNDSGDERTTLVTIGYVNPNKQIDRVIRALARNSALAERVRYLVVGPYDPASQYWNDLRSLVWESGLEDVVELLGYQPDDVLVATLKRADVCINLRSPSFEGGSASLMQQLIFGKPVVVAANASFAELPDDAVVKVPLEDELALERALERLVADEPYRRAVGLRARAIAAERTPTRYADELIAFLNEAESWGPVLELTDRVADELGVMGFGDELDAADDAERELSAFAFPDGGGFADRLVLRQLVTDDERALERFFLRNAVPQVTRTFDPFPLSTESARTIVSKPKRDRYYGAFLGRRVIGMTMLRGWDEGFDVPSFGVVVDRDFQGHRVGKRLTDFALAEASRLGSEHVRLSVYSSNPVAHEMYVRRGFKELEREPVNRAGVADERIVMIKALRDGP